LNEDICQLYGNLSVTFDNHKAKGTIMASSSARLDIRSPKPLTYLIVFICWLAILSEGYDVGVMGAILPSLATDSRWNLSPLELGALGSYALVGMFFGALAIGTLSDLYGRKWMFLFCIVLFSLTMSGAAWAPTPGLFGAFRFIGGLGLGGIIPIAAAYTIEFSPPEKRGVNYGLMYSGYSLGILLAAVVAIYLTPIFGWRTVVGVGLIPLVFVPVMAYLLPESIEFLVSKGRIDEARHVARARGIELPSNLALNSLPQAHWRTVLAEIFSNGNALATVCFWISISMGLLLVYGLNTWLPQIMRKAGYDLGSSLSFLVVFSLASAIGGVGIGMTADRKGTKLIVAISFLVGAVGIAALSFKGSLLVNYGLVALAGLGSISASLILTAYIANYYAPHARTSATGWAMAIARLGAMSGPLLGGYIASLQLDFIWNFLAFAAVAIIAAIAVLLIPERGSRIPAAISVPAE
jgi:AAHS family benzoate transporter-like MFS transporter